MVAKDWAKRFPDNAAPTTSTMLFLVRNGNPKGIKDWDDLVKPGVQVIVVNPKTGGNGRYTYLAAWGYVKKKGGTDAQARGVRRQAVQERAGAGARRPRRHHRLPAAQHRRRAGHLRVRGGVGQPASSATDKVDVVYPSISIVAENPVAVVERTVAKKGTARAGQGLPELPVLRRGPGDRRQALRSARARQAVLKKYAEHLQADQAVHRAGAVRLLAEAQKVHFNDGGQFDKIYTVK